jgi:hypothetical protein
MYAYPPAITAAEADELTSILEALATDREERRQFACHAPACMLEGFRRSAGKPYPKRCQDRLSREHGNQG